MVTIFIINGAFYSNSEVDLPNNTESLFVTSAGHHILLNLNEFSTIRPNGRRDYQILYVKSGKLHYTIGEDEFVCGENNIIIYRPYEPQFYTYYLKYNLDIYWIHFTGKDVDEWLTHIGLDGRRQFAVKESKNYAKLFDVIISELQRKLPNYVEIANLEFKELLYLFSRGIYQMNLKKTNLSKEVTDTISYFNKNYKEPFIAEKYAATLNMSVSWLRKLFKQQVGISLNKYLTNLRINKAKALMCSDLQIGDISEMVGFQDQLYFSRVFKQSTGLSPREYKNQQTNLAVLSVNQVPWKETKIKNERGVHYAPKYRE